MNEEVGKHKGAVETLLHEKKELSRILQIVNSQLERHMSALQEQGVDTDQFINQIQQQNQEQQKGRKQQRKSQSRSSNNNRKTQSRRGRSSHSSQRNQSRNKQEDGGGRGRSKEGDNQDFNPL